MYDYRFFSQKKKIKETLWKTFHTAGTHRTYPKEDHFPKVKKYN